MARISCGAGTGRGPWRTMPRSSCPKVRAWSAWRRNSKPKAPSPRPRRTRDRARPASIPTAPTSPSPWSGAAWARADAALRLSGAGLGAPQAVERIRGARSRGGLGGIFGRGTLPPSVALPLLAEQSLDQLVARLALRGPGAIFVPWQEVITVFGFHQPVMRSTIRDYRFILMRVLMRGSCFSRALLPHCPFPQ